MKVADQNRIVPGLVAIGTVIEPVPVTGFAANFSPMPRIAPPPLGREILGAANGVPSFGDCVLVSPFCLLGSSMNPPLQKTSLTISDPETDRLLSSVLSLISAGGERLAAVIPKMERWDPELGEPSFPLFTREDNIGVPRRLCKFLL